MAPNRSPAATRRVSSSMRRPRADMGRACSQAPDSTLLEARRRARVLSSMAAPKGHQQLLPLWAHPQALWRWEVGALGGGHCDPDFSTPVHRPALGSWHSATLVVKCHVQGPLNPQLRQKRRKEQAGLHCGPPSHHT